MKRVKKLNRELSISDDRLDEYLSEGYVELDNEGNEVHIKTSNDMKEAEYLKRISELEKENAELKKGNVPSEYDLLKAEAKELKISNYSKMKKDELQKAIEEAKQKVEGHED